MAFQVAAKNLALIVHIDPAVPEYILGDALRIRQCLAKCQDSGMDGYLTKPIEVEQLREVLDQREEISKPGNEDSHRNIDRVST